VKIEIKVTKSKPKKKSKTKKDEVSILDEAQKKNSVFEHIKNMNCKTKLVAGGIATALLIEAGKDQQKQEIQNQQQEIQQQHYTSYENTQQVDVQPEVIKRNPIEVDAKYLLNQYSNAATYEQQQKVDNMYKGEYLDVIGTVESVTSDRIILQNDNNDKWYSEWMGVYCNIENQQELAELKQLQTGDEVSVIGLCKGLDGLTVQLYHHILHDTF
jgi:hypothetical protein